MERSQCRCCGGALDPRRAENGVLRCEFCGAIWTIARKESDPAALAFLRTGEHELDVCRFDDAYTAFAKAAELDPKEPEAYFGMALATFRVQYLKDLLPETPRMQPICHEISQKKFTSDGNYLRAIVLATAAQRAEYERKGREINYIRQEFYGLEKTGRDYDCFLCAKVTNEQGDHTEDYARANEIYFHLKEKGYKPFFSEREIGSRTGADYEAMILYALSRSECMLVVCSDESYLQTKWVKNEYTRFLALINDEAKERDAITFVFAGKPIENLPGKKGIQGIDYTHPDAFSRIVDYVERHTPEARKREQEAQARKKEQEEALLRQIEEQKRLAEEQRRAFEEQQRILEEKLKRVQESAAYTAQTSSSSIVEPLLVRAKQELETDHFEQAKAFYNRVLDHDPQNAQAWWGLYLAENDARDEAYLSDRIDVKTMENTLKSDAFRRAARYADGELKQRIIAVHKRLRETAQTMSDDCLRQLEQSEKDQEELLSLRNAAHSQRDASESLVRKLPESIGKKTIMRVVTISVVFWFIAVNIMVAGGISHSIFPAGGVAVGVFMVAEVLAVAFLVRKWLRIRKRKRELGKIAELNDKISTYAAQAQTLANRVKQLKSRYTVCRSFLTNEEV